MSDKSQADKAAAEATGNTEFIAAVNKVRDLKSKPSNEEMLKLYALFKQGTEGDCTRPQPGIFSPKERAKWKAWTDLKGMSKEQAQREYVAHVGKLEESYS